MERRNTVDVVASPHTHTHTRTPLCSVWFSFSPKQWQGRRGKDSFP